MTQYVPDSIVPTEFLEKIASRLVRNGFYVQRKITAGNYEFDTVASRIMSPVPYSCAVTVVFMGVVVSNRVREYSSLAANYALDNRKSLQLRRLSLITIAAIVSSDIGEDVKRWISDTQPQYDIMSDRSHFPVLVDIDSREITYYKGSLYSHPHGPQYGPLRALADETFGFYGSDDEDPSA